MSPDFSSLQRAAKFAALHHRNQSRDCRDHGEVPYVAHPYRVCLTLSQVFGIDDSATLCAALLHDLIEDTTVDYDDILEEFGEEVADLVAGMSKDMRLPDDLREAAYDEQIRSGSWKLRAIKLADAYDNLFDCTESRRIKAIAKAERAIACAGDDERLAVAVEKLSEEIDEAKFTAIMDRELREQAGDPSFEIKEGEGFGG